LLAATLPVLIIGIIGIIAIRDVSINIIKTEVRNHLITATQSRKAHIETFLDEYKELTLTVSTGIPFQNMVDENIDYTVRAEQCYLRIKSIIKAHKEISRIRVLDKEGRVVTSSHQDIGFDHSKDDIFLKGAEEIFISDLHISKFTGKPVLSISAPILLEDQFSGVLVINYDAEEELFKAITATTGLGETGETYLVNKDGYMITPSRFVEDAVLTRRLNSFTRNRLLISFIGR